MEEFETITECEMLNMVWIEILRKLHKQKDFLEKNPNDSIALHWVPIYEKQEQEVYARLLKLEKEETA